MTRAQELLREVDRLMFRVRMCPTRRVLGACAVCDECTNEATAIARTALLATLRKQHLRLTYFAPDAERRALRERLRELEDA